MTFRGADTDDLRRVAGIVDDAAEQVMTLARQGADAARTLSWTGPDRDRFLQTFEDLRAAVETGLTTRLRDAANDLRRQATAQDDVSADLNGTVRGVPLDVPMVRRSLEGMSPAERARFLHDLVPTLSVDAARELLGPDWAQVRPFGRFDAANGPRDFGADLFHSMRYGEDLEWKTVGPPAEDEIEIRRLDNGKYIVKLPGVVDLTEGLDQGGARLVSGLARGDGAAALGSAALGTVAEWSAPNRADSARDMFYAEQSERSGQNGSVTGANAYAFAVKEALRSAGVPAGSDVMLVGHSFGAYTAMELAGDPTFNAAMGEPGGYRMNVTHVLAAGGNVGFRLDDLPPSTHAMVLVNDTDAAVMLERSVPTNNEVAERPGREFVSFRDVPTSKDEGYGHQPTVYGNQIRVNDDPALRSFLESAAGRYDQPGEMIRVTVKDAYR